MEDIVVVDEKWVLELHFSSYFLGRMGDPESPIKVLRLVIISTSVVNKAGTINFPWTHLNLSWNLEAGRIAGNLPVSASHN